MPRGGVRPGAGRKPATFEDCVLTVHIPGRNTQRLIIGRNVIETLFAQADAARALTDALTRAFSRQTRRRCSNTGCVVRTARRNADGQPWCSRCELIRLP